MTLDHKISGVVVGPAPGVVLQVALGDGVLAVRGCQMEPDWLDVPSVDVLRVADPAAQPPRGSTQLDPEEQAVGPSRKWKLQHSVHFEPPGLLEVSDRVESAPRQAGKTLNSEQINLSNSKRRANPNRASADPEFPEKDDLKVQGYHNELIESS